MIKDKVLDNTIELSGGSAAEACLSSPDNTTLTEEYRFIRRVAGHVREGKFVNKDEWLNVEISQHGECKEVTLTCPIRTERCKPLNEILTEDGVTFKVCQGLAPLYLHIKQQDEKKRGASRKVIECRKVGKYLYKLQPNQGGNLYWYIQFTEKGRSKTLYLGKNRPKFVPKDDLEIVRRKKASRMRAASASA
jgi:hypothetical protein